jgi:hypothetical protein
MGSEKRENARRFVRQPAVMINGDGSVLCSCVMLNVSATGALLKLNPQTALPHEFTLVLSRDGQLRRKCTVAWRSETGVGVRFLFETPAQRVRA